jgi:hypothetical protein
MERFTMVARLVPGGEERARELLNGAAPDLEPGLRTVSIFLTSTEVVFLCEGEDVERALREFFDDPVRSTTFSSWLPLFDGPVKAGHEAARWEAPAV